MKAYPPAQLYAITVECADPILKEIIGQYLRGLTEYAPFAERFQKLQHD